MSTDTNEDNRPKALAAETTADPAKGIWAVWIPIVATVAGLLGSGVGWGVSQYVELRKQTAAAVSDEIATQNRMIQDFLVPIQQNLRLTASVYKQLENYNERGWGILESYVIKETEGRNQSSALTFPLITNIVELDAEINSLLKRYAPYQLTSEFKSDSAAFLEHANTYIIRVKALPDIIKTKGALPSWKPFPKSFPASVEREIAARRSQIAQLQASR